MGGIGSGCIGLAGNGRLTDWEIFGRPNKGGNNGFSHFAVKAERNGQVIDARVLHGDTLGSLMGSRKPVRFDHYGHGPSRYTMSGSPFLAGHLRRDVPDGHPHLRRPGVPRWGALRAFNPFIPLNARDFSIPAAFFEVSLRNDRAAVIDYSVALAVTNPASPGFGVNRATRQDGLQLITLGQTEFGADHPRAGEITLGTDAQSVSCQEYWFRGRWFDNVTSTVPPAVPDAAASTMSVLKSPTVLCLEDGTFYGFEEGEPGRRQRRGQLHPCLELRLRLAVPVPGAGALYARRRLPLQRGGRRRHGIPPAAAAT